MINAKTLNILVDPPEAKTGIKLPKLEPEVILHTAIKDVGFAHPKGFDIATPGEYEVKGIEIQGIAAQLQIDKPEDPVRGIMYRISAGDINLLITGNIAPQLKEPQLEAIGDIDVLIMPVGGHGLTLEVNQAAKLISQFEPRYVIPVHYDDGKTKYPLPQNDLKVFLKEVGSEDVEGIAKLKIAAKDMAEETQIVVLNPVA